MMQRKGKDVDMAANEAYDLSLFEQRAKKERVQLKKLPSVKKQPRLQVAAMLAGRFLVALLVGAIISVGIYNRAILTETVDNITHANDDLAKLQSEQTRLAMELDEKVSIKNIEEYATNQLGLSRMDKYQTTYIALAGNDQIAEQVKTEEKPKLSLNINDLFYKLVEYIN